MRSVTRMTSRCDTARRPIVALGLIALVLAVSSAGAASPAVAGDGGGPTEQKTALDQYVAKPDDAYRFERVSVLQGDGYRAHVLDLVSQRWRNPWEVDRTEWHHWLTIVVPEHVRHSTALLWIGGGENSDPPPARASDRATRLAVETGSVVADLGMVPNQPLFFVDSPKDGRVEDDLIAYGREKYLVTGDVEWLVRLAMVKSGVRAMDAVQEYLRGLEGGGVRIDDFVVAGGSKRGWTTWLVAAVDPRVRAIVPLVIDALNSEVITRHHYEAYGFFSPALGDYVRHGLYPFMLGTEALHRILAIEDPYFYRGRDRLSTIPKFLVNAAGDQFFLPDNSRFYYADLLGEKNLRYVPNARHDLAGTDAQDSILAFYRAVLEDRPRPRFDWKTLDDETIVVTAQDRPRQVRLWQATNPAARDFRLDTIGKAWTSSVLTEQVPADWRGARGKPDSRARAQEMPPERAQEVPAEWRASLPAPPSGFTAFFVELTYDASPAPSERTASSGDPHGRPVALKLTTTVSVIPKRLPYQLDIEHHVGPWLGRDP